jgi:hypothetical protein
MTCVSAYDVSRYSMLEAVELALMKEPQTYSSSLIEQQCCITHHNDRHTRNEIRNRRCREMLSLWQFNILSDSCRNQNECTPFAKLVAARCSSWFSKKRANLFCKQKFSPLQLNSFVDQSLLSCFDLICEIGAQMIVHRRRRRSLEPIEQPLVVTIIEPLAINSRVIQS